MLSLALALVALTVAAAAPLSGTVHTYDLNYTTALPLAQGWEEQLLVAAVSGLWNRAQPSLLVRLTAADDAWLALARRPGGWLAGAALAPLPGLEALVAAFAPLGVVLYDPAVPATSLLAATLAGTQALLPVAYRPGQPAALYERLVAGGPRLPVLRSLVGAFNASAGATAKMAAYAYALRELMPQADARFLAYTGDAFCAGPGYASDAGAYDKIEVANLDWTIAQGGFAFDLGVWADEAPVDDPGQPLGADAAALRAVLRAAAAGAAAADAAQPFVHISGFVPWWCKYVGAHSAHAHGGVAAEWATAQLTSAFNAFVDADACCIGNLAGAAFWAHYPLAERYVQRAPPSRAALQAQGLLLPSGALPPSLRLLLFFYAGDYDSAAWLAGQLPARWSDPARGSVPLAWPVDPELALRFPPAFDLLLAGGQGSDAPRQGDVLTAGDSGAGYLNPTMLSGAPRAGASGLPDALGAWAAWNAAWNRQFGVSFTGFVINGNAPQMDAATEAAYAGFGGNGMAQGGGSGAPPHLAGAPGAVGGGAVVVPQLDLPDSVAEAVAALVARVPPPPQQQQQQQQQQQHSEGASSAPPAALMARSVLTSPTFLRAVAQGVANATGGAAAVVDPLAFGYLMRLALGGSNDDRVAYVADSLPGGGASGARLNFSATLRNDGWNALPAGGFALAVAVSAVEVWREVAAVGGGRVRQQQQQQQQQGAAPTLARAAAAAAGAAGDRGRWPAHARRAAIAGKRVRAARACRLPGGAPPQLFPLPADLPLGGALAVPASVLLPAAALALGAEGCSSSASGSGQAVVVAEVTYELVALPSAQPLSANGILPWVAMVVVQ